MLKIFEYYVITRKSLGYLSHFNVSAYIYLYLTTEGNTF